MPGNRDNTDFDQVGDFENNPYTMALDVEQGWVFAVANRRIQVWDARSNPGSPTQRFNGGFRNLNLTWTPDAHAFFIFTDIDAPDGDPDVFAVTGIYGMGMAIYDSTIKDTPALKYQDHGAGRAANQVYATTIGGQDYAFVAADTAGGIFAYNMSNAKALSSRCTEAQPGATLCPGVYLGKIGSRTRVKYIDGAGNFIVASSAISPKGFEIFNVANPSAPFRVMEGLTSESVYGVAMWQQGSNYFLALRTQNQGRIYNVSCVTGGSCSLGSPLWTQAMPSASSPFVTFSRSNGTPFVYFGFESDCVQGNQQEWLFDVSSPSNPQDISPQGTAVIDGEPVSYWGWYYRRNGVHGFNRVAPRMGKFHNDHFFRAAFSIFDIHRRTGGSPPNASFSFNPSEIYPNTAISFTDTSTGAPSAWDWDFLPDGVPSTSGTRNPSGVTFPSTGSKTVRLEVTNGAGSDTAMQTLTVLDPAPAVASVSVSPNPALVCQPVTFTAQNVTGRPPRTFSWQVRQTGGGTVATGGNLNPFVWTSDPDDITGVTYVAEVTVTNADGSASRQSPTLLLNPLAALPPSNSFSPTYVGQPADPPTGTVQFNVAVAGATEWNWNFGDNPGGGPDNDGYTGWTSDPVNGPAPSHSYTQAGTYNVRVKVRNCVEAERESNPISVNITTVTPLEAHFQATGLFCQSGGCFATVGVPVTFVDSSTGPPQFWDYDWDANGTYDQPGRTAPVTSHTFTQTGTFRPRLRVRLGTQTDVFDHAQQIIVESDGGGGDPDPAIMVQGPTTGSVNQSLTFTANASNCTPSATGWSWSTAGGNVSGSSNQSSITISWASAGSKLVRAANSSCGTASGSRSVNITGGGGGGGTLNAVFTFTPSNPTAGQSVSFDASASGGAPQIFSWSFGDGGTGTGQQVSHSYANPGSYSVSLEVSKEDPGCSFGICEDVETRTVVVSNSGPPPLQARFTANASCFGTAGQEVCETETGQEVQFTDTSVGDVNGRSWDFGDGGTASAAAPTHTFTEPGTYLVRLTVSNDDEEDDATKTFTVTGDPPPPPPPPPSSVLVPWVAQSDGALDQLSALYVHNPDNQARDVILRFFQRRSPTDETPPPEVMLTLAAGETAYFPDVLHDEFGLSNVSGFIEIEVDGEDSLAPTAVSYHRTFNAEGLSFGQAVPAITGDSFPRGVRTGENEEFHLIGLNDNGERLAFFGLTNPNDKSAQFQLRFYNQLGEPIGITPEPMGIGAMNNRQFQVEALRQTFGISESSDYRIAVEVLSNGPLFIYGANLRLPALDPSYVRVGEAAIGKVYLLGVLATQGLNNTQWQTDVVLGNVAGAAQEASITFTSAGNGAEPLDPVILSLLPGETLRLENVLADRFGLAADNSLGFLSIDSDGSDDTYPLIQAETYDIANPAGRFGQFMPALHDAQAAGVGKRQILTGLQQDEGYRSTVWLLNPGEQTGEYDLVYRALNGSEIGRLSGFRVAPHSMRQINPGNHPLVDGQVEGGFTIQVIVRQGQVLSAAQVVNSVTNDPAFVAGVTR